MLLLKRFAKLADGDKVQLVGFGAFMTRKRKSHEKRNPRYYRLVYHIFAG
ncbi:MAG: HU family DNA-binding protein [Acholeplasmataceae bacterium]|nr:HU family DNA-binding protein [Acholeplasmataceae bacterium]